MVRSQVWNVVQFAMQQNEQREAGRQAGEGERGQGGRRGEHGGKREWEQMQGQGRAASRVKTAVSLILLSREGVQ